MTNRRKFIKAVAGVPLFLPMFGWYSKSDLSNAGANNHSYQFRKGQTQSTHDRQEHQTLTNDWFMPEEGDPHECTWMSFGASKSVWGADLLEAVRSNLATVAQAIARFEPVVMCVRPNEAKLAKDYFTDLTNIEFFECPLNDLWIRDYGAVYVINEDGDKAAVDFNFNGWGEKQDFEHDAEVAAMMAEESDVELIETDLCLEGGGIEVDGEGAAIITESCVLNENRNPEWTKRDCETELRRVLGLEKIIWLPGVRDADITDGHTDSYARFAKPGVVIAHFDTDKKSPEHELTKRHKEILESATDAHGNSLKIVLIDGPTKIRDTFRSKDFCAGYINFYVCNGAVIAPEFGDPQADGLAKEKLAEAFPDREIVMLNIDGIAAGGGGIHCATQQEPAD
jgi:agmatine deiminase